MKKTSNITQEQINKSRLDLRKLQFSGLLPSWCCPIKLAMKEAGFCDPLVSTSKVSYSTGLWIDLPQSAKDFIEGFDNGRYVRPFSFEIEVPV